MCDIVSGGTNAIKRSKHGKVIKSEGVLFFGCVRVL